MAVLILIGLFVLLILIDLIGSLRKMSDDEAGLLLLGMLISGRKSGCGGKRR